MAILLPTKEELVLLPEWYETNPNIEQDLEKILSTMKTYRARIPVGYKIKGNPEVNGFFCEPVECLLCGLVQLLKEFRYEHKRSLADCLEQAQKMCKECEGIDYTVSSKGGLSIILTRLEEDLGLIVKDTSRERIPKLRRERNEALKATGNKQLYHFSATTKEKVEKQKKLTSLNKELKNLKAREKRLKRQAAQRAKSLNLQKDPTKYVATDESGRTLVYEGDISAETKKILGAPAVLEQDIVDIYLEGLSSGRDEYELMEIYKEIMDDGKKLTKKKIAFLPTPRQYMFLSSPEDIVLYGGAAG